MRNVYVSVRFIKSKTKAGDSLAGKKHTSGEMHLRTKVKVEIVKKEEVSFKSSCHILS